MQTYAEYAPTGFDHKGAFLPDRQAWLVVLGHNRDSDALAESNWETALDLLGGESETVEIHRFSHWACGWCEIILVAPDSPQATEAEAIEDRLVGYPALNEEDWSNREWEAAADYWDNQSPRAKVQYAMHVRSKYHWLQNTPVWPYGRLSYYDVANRGDTISEAIYESLRE